MVSVKDGHGWFLSTGHVFGQYNAVYIEGTWYKVEVAHRWNNLNLNEHLILLRTVQKLPDKNYLYFRIAEDHLSAGDAVNYVGFPSNRYTVRPTKVVPYNGSVLHTFPGPRQGGSGGGIVKGGNLYGIIHSYTTLTLIGNSHNLSILLPRMQQDAPGVFTTNRPELKPKIVAPPPEIKKWPTLPKSPVVTPSLPKSTTKPSSPLKTKPKVSPSVVPIPTEKTPSPVLSDAGPPVTSTFLSSVREKASNPGLWLDLLTGAALLAGTGGTGFVGWKAIRYLPKLIGGVKKIKSTFPSSEPMLHRDDTELKQVIGLREQEQRTPLHDGFFGVALEDEYKANPDQTIKEAFEKATARFNSVAPLSVKTTSSCNNNTGEEE